MQMPARPQAWLGFREGSGSRQKPNAIAEFHRTTIQVYAGFEEGLRHLAPTVFDDCMDLAAL